MRLFSEGLLEFGLPLRLRSCLVTTGTVKIASKSIHFRPSRIDTTVQT